MIEWFKSLFKCKHKNTYLLQYKRFGEDTPRNLYMCFDCGYRDEGIVYTNPDEWPESRLTRIIDGVKTVEDLY